MFSAPGVTVWVQSRGRAWVVNAKHPGLSGPSGVCSMRQGIPEIVDVPKILKYCYHVSIMVEGKGQICGNSCVAGTLTISESI